MGFDCEAGNVLSNLNGKVLLIFRSSQSRQQFCDQPNVWSNFLEYNFYDLPTYMLSVIILDRSRVQRRDFNYEGQKFGPPTYLQFDGRTKKPKI